MFDACSSCCLLPDIFKEPPSQWFSQFSSVPRPMRNGRWSTPPVTMEPNCRSRGAVSSRGLWGFWDGFFNGYSRLTHQIMVGDFSLWSNLGFGVCEFLFSWWMNMPSNKTSSVWFTSRRIPRVWGIPFLKKITYGPRFTSLNFCRRSNSHHIIL